MQLQHEKLIIAQLGIKLVAKDTTIAKMTRVFYATEKELKRSRKRAWWRGVGLGGIVVSGVIIIKSLE